MLTLYSIIFATNSAALIKSGLNTQNFGLLINSLILFSYTFCYAITALRHQKPWLKSIQGINFCLAIIVILLALVINNYWVKHASFDFGKIDPSNHTLQEQLTKRAQQHYQLQQGQFKKLGFKWSKANLHELILGYNQTNPLKICQVQIAGKYYSGTINNNRCEVIKQGKVITTKNFAVLSGPKKAIQWKTWVNSYSINNKSTTPFSVGIEGQKIFYICRLIYRNRIYLGIYDTDSSRCHFIVAGKIKQSEALQYLYVKD